MLRRAFLKFAAVAMLTPILNWQMPCFANDSLSIAQIMSQRHAELYKQILEWWERNLWTAP